MCCFYLNSVQEEKHMAAATQRVFAVHAKVYGLGTADETLRWERRRGGSLLVVVVVNVVLLKAESTGDVAGLGSRVVNSTPKSPVDHRP
eukprot:jgi/Chlat1/4923/Chrsp31S04841